jgi:hypothetical protein
VSQCPLGLPLNTGELTYCYPREQSLKKRIVACERFENLQVRRDVDENSKSIFRNGRIVFDKQLQILDGLQLVALEKGNVGLRVPDKMLRSCSVRP